MSRVSAFVSAPFEMNPMKRLPLVLILSATFLPFASCKSESPTEPSAAPGASPAAAAADAPAPTPPPGAVEVSEATFQQELEKNPGDPAAHYNLGTIYLASGKFAEAAEQFK